MSDFEGVYGEYKGPKTGDTETNDSDLHSSGNPHGTAGAPPIDESRSSDFPPPNPMLGTPYGYFTNPQITDTHNPHALGSGGEARPAGENELTRYVGGNLDAAYGEAMDYQQGSSLGGADQASGGAASIYRDEGFGPSGTGRS